jgi:hypothetical protein
VRPCYRTKFPVSQAHSLIGYAKQKSPDGQIGAFPLGACRRLPFPNDQLAQLPKAAASNHDRSREAGIILKTAPQPHRARVGITPPYLATVQIDVVVGFTRAIALALM